MKTVQINDFLSVKERPKLYKLLQEIYSKFLKDDHDFHYFYEPELIIRIENIETINVLVEWLKKKNYLVEVYDYPNPKNKRHYGENSIEQVKKYDSVFLPLFHTISKFFLDTKKEDHMFLRERIIHSSFNMDGKNYFEEAEILASYAINRAAIAGMYSKPK